MTKVWIVIREIEETTLVCETPKKTKGRERWYEQNDLIRFVASCFWIMFHSITGDMNMDDLPIRRIKENKRHIKQYKILRNKYKNVGEEGWKELKKDSDSRWSGSKLPEGDLIYIKKKPRCKECNKVKTLVDGLCFECFNTR